MSAPIEPVVLEQGMWKVMKGRLPVVMPCQMGVEWDTCCMGSKVVSIKSSPRWQQDQNAMQAMAKMAASKCQ